MKQAERMIYLALSHGNVTPGLEHHHGDGASWERIADDELCDNVQADLLVSDGLDHPDRNDIGERCESTSVEFTQTDARTHR
jgi:hypothetical protein